VSLRDEILAETRAVPSLPIWAVEVLDIASQPDPDIGALEQCIALDPGLTSNVLRLANSAYFGGVGEISTVRDAVVRLGTRHALGVVVASAIAPVAGAPVRGYDMPAGLLLRHSVAVAMAAERLGERLGLETPAATFTAGLLHELGKMVLGTFLEIDARPILALAFEQAIPFQDAERQVLGVDHAEVGAVLLESWRVPQAIVEVVRWHHEPERFGGAPMMLDLVHIGDHLGRMAGGGLGVDGLNYAASDAVIGRLKMGPAVAESVISEVSGGLDELQRVLGGSGGN
jgi:putative nucleotidyltransferase with HDIG domain